MHAHIVGERNMATITTTTTNVVSSSDHTHALSDHAVLRLPVCTLEGAVIAVPTFPHDK